MGSAGGCRETMSAFRGLRSSGNFPLIAHDPEQTKAGPEMPQRSKPLP